MPKIKACLQFVTTFTMMLLVPLALSGCVSFILPTGALVGSALIIKDPRTIGAYVSDKVIALQIKQDITKILPKNQIHVTSYNRAILLTGKATYETERAQAEAISQGHTDVRKTFNYIQVNPSLKTSAYDAWITTKIYSNLLAEKIGFINRLKIITEHGVVYLMGLVEPEEAARVADIASKTSSVEQVIVLTESPSPKKSP